jgi:hypothetical protein
VLLKTNVTAQTDSSTSRFGTYFSFDLAYNLPDKVLNSGMSRKWSVGLSFSEAERKYVAFCALGIKGFKINFASPVFMDSFLDAIEQNYNPIENPGLDSLIGVKMTSSPGTDLWGTYSQYMHLGIILNKKTRTSLSAYVGFEQFLLHDKSFAQFEDPEYGDINYVSMNTIFYEFKLGIALPPINRISKSNSFFLNLGYKVVDYRNLQFKNTPISSYTNESFAQKFNRGDKFTFSISYTKWTNWGK